MLTHDELIQLRELIREEIEAEAKHIRHDGASERLAIKSSLFHIENRLKDVEIAVGRTQKELEETRNVLEQRITDVAKDIQGSLETTNELVIKIVGKKLEDHEERIEMLENSAILHPQ